MVRKEFANIGKYMIRQLSSSIEIYHTTQDDPALHSYQTEKKRLSKSQILQFMYYHFLPVDERGVISYVSEKEVANAIGCSIRTVRNNNVVLENAQLIFHSRSGKTINVWILPYPQYFQEGGSGYLSLEFNRFTQWIAIDNVNALRMELRKELVYDNNTVKRLYHKEDTSVISMNDLKLFLPKYTHYRGKIEEIVSKGTPAFNTEVNNSSIVFTIQPGYMNGKMAKEMKREEYRSIIEQTIHSLVEAAYVSEFTKKDREDFVQLAFEYGPDQVIKGLEILIAEMFSADSFMTIHNMGGKLRTLIRIQFTQDTHDQVARAITA
jgi:hypothetical protein